MTFASSTKGIAVSALLSLASSAWGATFVYVSNAEDGNIGVYRMNPDTGELQPGENAKAANLVMPMAVSPNRRFLYAAIRSKPFAVMTYSIDPSTGALKHQSTAPLAESFPYISLDKKGRYLFGASYGGHVVSVNAVGADGKVSDPLQVIPIGRNAHSIRIDESNKYVYVPSLGSDQMFQFIFDEKTGRLASNTPAVVLLKPLTGPRHFIVSRDNRFVYALNELLGTVTTFSLDGKTGLLTEVASVSGLPPDTKLGPGLPRGAIGGANAPPPRNTDNDVWAADIHATPNGKFVYITERTTSSIGTLSVNEATGALSFVGSTPTEKQPRGFAIDPKGKYLVASGEKSGTISVYAIDPASGALRPVGQYPTGKGSNWVEIVSFD